MCIRDSLQLEPLTALRDDHLLEPLFQTLIAEPFQRMINTCLLYTSDAADERSSVDLGGRRIIKKKKNKCIRGWATATTTKTDI